ncbi:HAF repeat-containing protein [Massilia aurea]|uniref:HAF repeat-containing protein n=1 Tax=Massilia aurea TaxID=373040 RepID=UPI00346200C1
MLMHCRFTLLLLLFAVAGSAMAYPEYRVTVVGPADSRPTGINQIGVVVGYYTVGTDRNRAFLNRGNGLVDLGTLTGTQSNAVAINDRGEVLGNWRTSAGQWRGFIYSCGKARDIGAIPGTNTTYIDINNAGNVIVRGQVSQSGNEFSYLRTRAGRFTNLGNLPGMWPGQGEPRVNQAFALNNRNQVTGQSGPMTVPDDSYLAYIWIQGALRNLGDLGYAPNVGNDINDHAQITGSAALQTGTYNAVAFLYAAGRMVSLDNRPATEEKYSSGNGINNRGYVVGSSNHLSGFIWRGRRMQSLNALIDPRFGWDITDPRAINDAGQIAAVATRNGVQYTVRLDLIRPISDPPPALGPDPEAAMSAQSAAPGEDATMAAAEAAAQAREVAQPVAQ